MTLKYFSTGSGRIELTMTIADARRGSHSGRCDEDIAALRSKHAISSQLAAIKPALLREELREYGAWDDDDLSDHDQNLSRLLWLACGDIVEELTS